jgi:hypothetical protein
LQSIAILYYVYDLMSDLVGEKYELDSSNANDLVNYLLWFYKDFWVNKSFIWVFKGRNYFFAEYLKKIWNDMKDYGELMFRENLVAKFVARTLYEKYWDKINQISSEKFVNAELEELGKMRKELKENWIDNLKLMWSSVLVKK